MRYKLKILTRAKTHTYILKDIPMYEWDNVLGFDVERDELISKLNDLQTLKEITKLMISRGFLDEFYEILNKERRYSELYKYALPTILFSVQYSLFQTIAGFKQPGLVYIESYQDKNGDYIKYDYIDKRWSYDFLITNSNSLGANQEDSLETGLESLLQEGVNE
ncbi:MULTISPECIES: DUF1473 family protein [Borreliella]|uniref:Uncharacterized protein n=2 Tax=Borreliella afzelii TaxID=29518 RepID=Q0SLW0_BORAP|nr:MULTISPECIES: DUF1473 family protein [Borreliella]ABH02168.1 hypothetical protein BAPKO_2046 [Borreliella afzelii PKo]ACJ73579.1 conserved hypothetical protein [Borreliella afzelii ACA-1]AJY72861.1 hypothetical protein BAFK78_A046 [Borreliella afzelii K78]APJ09182.1 hypothetical protein BLA32_04680 [Borreliella afzelii]AEL70664.1 conserved hypothetical protein [Borreliella afzelii PKo]